MAEPTQLPPQFVPKYRLNGIYVKDISFENPLAPGIFIQPIEKPAMNVSVDINIAPLQESTFEVALKVTARADSEGGKAVFLVEIVYAGVFSLNPALEPHERDKTLLVDCASYLFPFARRLIADLVQEGSFPPLLLEPINFEAVYNARKAQAA